MPQPHGERNTERMKMPCEYGVWFILPSIRASLVEEMLRQGIPQSRVAGMLGITPASVSQYAAKKRGYRIEFEEEIRAAIQALAAEISAGGEVNVVSRICSICAMVREYGIPCDPRSCTGRGEGAPPVRHPSGPPPGG